MVLKNEKFKNNTQGCHNVRKIRKNQEKQKNEKSPEKSGENGGF